MKNVVVLTNSNDGSNTDEVVNHIKNLEVNVIRINSDEITSGDKTLSIIYNKKTQVIEYDGKIIDSIRSIWFRRPYSFSFNIEDGQQCSVAEEEFRDVLDGLFLLWSNSRWVSSPGAIAAARIKPYQISIAKKVGFIVPKTLITNNVSIAENFCDSHKTVFKPMSGYSFEYDGRVHSAFTTLVNPDIRKNIKLIKNQHVMLQEFVSKKAEVRVTCVGRKLFATSIYCEDFENVVDQRTPENYNKLTYSEVKLPFDLEVKIFKLINELNLEYAAIDLAIDKEGDYNFFEVNPIGQWLWLEEITGQPITEALAKHLVYK